MKIDFDNKTYAFVYANYRLSNVILGNKKFLFDEIHESISENPDLKPALDFLAYVIKQFEQTEKYNYYSSFHCLFACCNYLFNPNISTLEEFRKEFEKIEEDQLKKDFIHFLLTAYTQQKDYQNAIEFASQYSVSPLCDFIQSYAYYRVNDLENCYKSGLLSFEKEEVIGLEILGNFITFQLFLGFSSEQKENSFNKLKEKFANENTLKIATFFSIAHTLSSQEIDGLANFVFHYVDEYGNNYKEETIVFCGNLQKYDFITKLIGGVIDFSNYSKLYDCYVFNLIHLKEDSLNLLEKLEKRREFEIEPISTFLGKEIELLHLIFDFEQILIVAQLGLDTFKEEKNINYFAYHKLIALYNLNRKKELASFINENHAIFTVLDFSEIKHIIRIFAHVGCISYIIDKVFDEAIKGDFEAKEIYFSVMGNNDELLKWEDKVEINSWIEILNLNTNQKEIKEVNKSNPFLNQFLGKAIGDKVTKNSFNGSEEYQIAGIYNKYLGLYRKICLEADSIDSSLSSFTLLNNDIQELKRIFMEKIGKEGDEEEQRHKDYQEKYKKGDVTFYDICKLCQENPIKAYWYIVNCIKEFRTIPSILFREIEIAKTSNFILDFSTIPLLYEISKSNNMKFDVHFSTSPLVLLKYEQYLEELKSSKESLRLHVTSDRVEPIFQSKEEVKNTVEYIENLINWIKGNCKIEYARNKLDIVGKLTGKNKIKNINQDFLFNYLIDISFLKEKENSVLVTDDMIYSKHFQNGVSISSDYFLHLFFQNDYSLKALPTLLERNYVGIRVDFSNLKKNYLSRKENSDLYNTSLKNLDGLNTLDILAFESSIKLIKVVLNDTNLIYEEKREEIKSILTNFLRSDNIKQIFLEEISSVYNFFICYSTEYIEMVCDEFKIQLNSLN